MHEWTWTFTCRLLVVYLRHDLMSSKEIYNSCTRRETHHDLHHTLAAPQLCKGSLSWHSGNNVCIRQNDTFIAHSHATVITTVCLYRLLMHVHCFYCIMYRLYSQIIQLCSKWWHDIFHTQDLKSIVFYHILYVCMYVYEKTSRMLLKDVYWYWIKQNSCKYWHILSKKHKWWLYIASWIEGVWFDHLWNI